MTTADAPAPMPNEVEASLVLTGDDPLGLRQALGRLKLLGRYRLEARPSVVIHDAYLDTTLSDLLCRRLSLRLRELNGRPRLTLKGEASESETVLKVRSELEVDWSQEGLEQILSVLTGYGIHLQLSGKVGHDSEPMSVLRACGLKVIQERNTERMLRDVLAEEGPEALAEMAIDVVSYHVGRTIRHDEVEVELKGGSEPDLIRQLIDLLLSRYPGQLEPWSIAKLTLGMLLERLAEAGQLEAMLGSDDRLSRAAYGALRAAISDAGLP